MTGWPSARTSSSSSTFNTPLDIYRMKVEGWEKKQNPMMLLGLRAEPIIEQYYTDEFPDAQTFAFPLLGGRFKDEPILRMTPDRLAWSAKRGTTLLEFKLTSADWDSPPMNYYVQVQHYAGMLGLEHGDLVALRIGRGRRGEADIWTFPVDYEFIEPLWDKATEWWEEHIVKETPPEPVSGDDVSYLYPAHSEGKVIEASGELVGLVAEFARIKSGKKAYEKQEKELKTRIAKAMKDAEEITYEGRPLLSYRKAADSKRFSSKLLKENDPDLYEQYRVMTSGNRTMLVKDAALELVGETEDGDDDE